ncbi:MAG TPA: hypothetical protein EYQ69_07935, partial [Gemmatimonadetes bacterium]|nr:hypothetical protein [Gemmatimonadota bacterium]
MDDTQINFESDVKAVDSLVEKYKALHSEIGKVIVGQSDVIEEVNPSESKTPGTKQVQSVTRTIEILRA